MRKGRNKTRNSSRRRTYLRDMALLRSLECIAAYSVSDRRWPSAKPASSKNFIFSTNLARSALIAPPGDAVGPDGVVGVDGEGDADTDAGMDGERAMDAWRAEDGSGETMAPRVGDGGTTAAALGDGVPALGASALFSGSD